nr:MAG TPA: hypothetical protein [Caudoviricetes sp.]
MKDDNRTSVHVSGACGYSPNASRKEKHLLDRASAKYANIKVKEIVGDRYFISHLTKGKQSMMKPTFLG